jgi:hypothetical protein
MNKIQVQKQKEKKYSGKDDSRIQTIKIFHIKV